MIRTLPACVIVFLASIAAAQSPPQIVETEGQPLAANVLRLLDALELIGAPLPAEAGTNLRQAARSRDPRKIQELLDPRVLLVVEINPEARVKVTRGPFPGALQQAGYTPVIVKVINAATTTAPLRIVSPQAGPPYAGVAKLSMERQDQPKLRENENTRGEDRFLDVDIFRGPPMTAALSGLEAEYAIALIYSSEAGRREATIGFDLGSANQDLGFRGEVPILFDIRPALPVKLSVRDADGQPTTARLVFRDAQGHIYPPQARRLAPDLFFQEQVYRADGQTVLLPAGEYELESSRGPEYVVQTRKVTIAAGRDNALGVRLERWVDPMAHGFYCGDHHIHAAGCAHYTSPTEGISPADVFALVKGEGLNVGCILTWGPCYDYQRKFFSPGADKVSEPLTIIKYDIEVSGFGSAALGHVCLLNLKDQTYPGSDGTSTKGWPKWTTPVMRWTKQQGGIAGYAHSASGIKIDPEKAATRMMRAFDTDANGFLTPEECREALLPELFDTIDLNHDDRIDIIELTRSHDRVADELPNFAIPEMLGPGAAELAVSTAEGVCDFISSHDTARIQEWNSWYHLMNCGYPLKVSGETDFPCMSGTRVGQGRVYVQLGPRKSIDFGQWCEGIRAGRSYVSDGYAHALKFAVNAGSPGDKVALPSPDKVRVTATVSFAPRTPIGVPYGNIQPGDRRRDIGDTVLLHGPRPTGYIDGGERLVEIVVNGRPVAQRKVPADGKPHDLAFTIPIERSSWVALRQFPQLHTNPVDVIVGGQPIRASRRSALWAVGCIEQLWRSREKNIPEPERTEAKATFERAIETYKRIAGESFKD